MMVEQDHAHSNHMVIENANVYGTPDQKGILDLGLSSVVIN